MGGENNHNKYNNYYHNNNNNNNNKNSLFTLDTMQGHVINCKRYNTISLKEGRLN